MTAVYRKVYSVYHMVDRARKTEAIPLRLGKPLKTKIVAAARRAGMSTAEWMRARLEVAADLERKEKP